MNTQYEKNSVFIARSNYRMKRREQELRSQLTLFLISLGGVCAVLYMLVSAISK